jgi:hypothetical protein
MTAGSAGMGQPPSMIHDCLLFSKSSNSGVVDHLAMLRPRALSLLEPQ